MTSFEIEIVKAIGKHYPEILNVLDQLAVSSRENTGVGSFANFKPIASAIDTSVQVLDLHGTIDFSNGDQLGAHIEMRSGIPLFLEICCFSPNGWDGSYANFKIHNQAFNKHRQHASAVGSRWTVKAPLCLPLLWSL